MAVPGFSPRVRRRRAVWLPAVLAAVALLATACSSSGSTSAAGSDGSCPDGCKLTVVTPNLDPSGAITIYLADDLGLFKKYGVNVTRINGVAAGSVPLLTSGKADLIDEGATTAFPVQKQGMQISEVYNDIGGGALGGLAVAANSPYQSVNDLSGKKVGTVGTTGTQYGFTNLFSSDVKQATGKGFTIVPLADNTTLINSVESGAIAGAGGSRSIFSAALKTGKLRLVADTSDETQRLALLGTSYTSDTAITGLKKNLAAKHEAVVRFLQALVDANVYLHSHSLSDVATQLEKDKLFTTLPAGSVLTSITAQQPFFTPNKGYVSEDLWNATLGLFTRWDIPTIGDVKSNPTFSYSSVIDMSFLTEAMGRNGVAVPTGAPSAGPSASSSATP